MHHHDERPQVRMRLSREVRAMLKAEVERRPMTSESAIIETAVKQLLSPEVQRSNLDTHLTALRKDIAQLAQVHRPVMPNLGMIENRLASQERAITDMRNALSAIRTSVDTAERRYFIRFFSTIGGLLAVVVAVWWLIVRQV